VPPVIVRDCPDVAITSSVTVGSMISTAVKVTSVSVECKMFLALLVWMFVF